MPESHLGPYQLTRLIRASSTHEIWEAVDGKEDQRYALKVLRPSYRADRSKIASMHHEFHVMQTLKDCPRTIQVHGFRTDGETQFLVLELFSELNLKNILRRGPETLAPMLEKAIRQAAEALHCLHNMGWIHRDVSPNHFLISRGGEIRLIDFSSAAKKRSRWARFFHRPQVRGTRNYMSPECIRGKWCDERSDIYSFGCVVFELVTGRRPFSGTAAAEQLSQHLYGEVPDLAASNADVSADFASLVMRMMAKHPADRPASMEAFLKEFRTVFAVRRWNGGHP